MTQTPARPHVLLVDTISDEREMYALALSQEGFVPVHASTSAWAFDYATTTPPALIVTDEVLDHEDGLTFARRLRMAEATREVPIIVLSGRVVNLVKSTSEALDAGADLFLLKPCVPAELVAQSRALIAKSAQLGQRADDAIANASRLQAQRVDRLFRADEQLKPRD